MTGGTFGLIVEVRVTDGSATRDDVEAALLAELDGSYDTDDGATIDVVVISAKYSGKITHP